MTIKLEMKSIKHFAANSQETYCYTGKVYVNGKPFAEVGNQGHGGSDFEYADPRCKNFSEINEQVRAYFASLPKEERWGMVFDQSFEVWCGEQVTLFLHTKALKRMLKKFVGIKDGSIYTWKTKWTGQNLEQYAEHGYTMLNGMDFDKALVLYINNA